jgi:hypothetical protein
MRQARRISILLVQGLNDEIPFSPQNAGTPVLYDHMTLNTILVIKYGQQRERKRCEHSRV